jgi:hypothetical protein
MQEKSNANLQNEAEPTAARCRPREARNILNFVALTGKLNLRRIRCTPTSSWRIEPSSEFRGFSRPELSGWGRSIFLLPVGLFLPLAKA